MAKKPAKADTLPMIENRKARHDYHIEDTLECGIALMGSEIKSVRDGHVSLAEGFVRITEQPPTLTLYKVHIGEYTPAAALGHAATRTRILLANKSEIHKWAKKMSKGMTIVPLKMYFKGPWAKLLIGLAKGKQAHDKRQDIAKKDAARDMQRAMSRRQ
ncbi:MAG TPA: SsrA-binding protein SmpB [Phycisphaerales bacterium]|nr:SsrA-binding protein SmpB [Phycisphaerales bacterium]